MSEYEPATCACSICGKQRPEFHLMDKGGECESKGESRCKGKCGCKNLVCKKCCRAGGNFWESQFRPMKRKGAGPK